MTFLTVWITWAICGVTLFSAIFAWAVRGRQFSDQDRARYLSLNAAQILDEAEPVDVNPGRIDRYTWVFLLLMSLLICAAAMWIGAHGKPG